MSVRTEITVRLPNSPGALTGVCGALASEHVGIAAMALDSGRVRLVVDNEVRAIAALRERYHQVDVRDVMVLRVSNAAGAVAPVLALLANAGINIEYAYGAAAEGSAAALVVVGVDDPLRAATLAGA